MPNYVLDEMVPALRRLAAMLVIIAIGAFLLSGPPALSWGNAHLGLLGFIAIVYGLITTTLAAWATLLLGLYGVDRVLK